MIHNARNDDEKQLIKALLFCTLYPQYLISDHCKNELGVRGMYDTFTKQIDAIDSKKKRQTKMKDDPQQH